MATTATELELAEVSLYAVKEQQQLLQRTLSFGRLLWSLTCCVPDSLNRLQKASWRPGIWTICLRISGLLTGKASGLDCKLLQRHRCRLNCLTQWLCILRLNPNKPAPVSKLRELGVLSWKLDAANPESDPKLQAIRNIRGYSYQVQFCNM